MRVKLMNGSTAEVNESYGTRLIEQGKAVLEKDTKTENAPDEQEKQKTRKAGKGE